MTNETPKIRDEPQAKLDMNENIEGFHPDGYGDREIFTFELNATVHSLVPQTSTLFCPFHTVQVTFMFVIFVCLLYFSPSCYVILRRKFCMFLDTCMCKFYSGFRPKSHLSNR